MTIFLHPLKVYNLPQKTATNLEPSTETHESVEDMPLSDNNRKEGEKGKNGVGKKPLEEVMYFFSCF